MNSINMNNKQSNNKLILEEERRRRKKSARCSTTPELGNSMLQQGGGVGGRGLGTWTRPGPSNRGGRGFPLVEGRWAVVQWAAENARWNSRQGTRAEPRTHTH